MNRAVRALRAVSALLLCAATACTAADSGVRTGVARKATVAEIVEAPATLDARTMATVTAAAAGRVRQLFVSDGQQVRSGDLIAVIDSPQVRQRVDQARRAVDAVGSGAGRTRIDLVSGQQRTDRAAAKAFGDARKAADGVADPQLRSAALAQLAAAEAQYRAVAEQARDTAAALARGIGRLGAAVNAVTAAQRLQAQAAYELARTQEEALTLRAPVDGTVQLGGVAQAGGDLSDLVGQLPAELQGQASQLGGGLPAPQQAASGSTVAVGSQVTPGTAVATVVDLSSVGVLAAVDETDVLLVKSGAMANVDLDAVPGAVYRSTVDVVGMLPTASSRGGVSYRVRLKLGAGTFADGRPAPRPLPGMSAVAKIEVRRADDVVAVPAAAVVRDGSRDVVWVVDRGRASRRTVTIGAQGEDMVEVTDGVRAGERIVVGGADRVKAGQDLR